MLDIGKIADLCLLLIDASFGFEMVSIFIISFSLFALPLTLYNSFVGNI